MYYHLCDHIYITQFKDELILLDTKKDKYTVCFQELGDNLMKALSNDSSSIPSKTLDNLLSGNIIREKDNPFPFEIDRKIESDGVSQMDWVLPLDAKTTQIDKEVLKALGNLIKINVYIKALGFHRAIQLIKDACKPEVEYVIPSEKELEQLTNVVNKACLFYPSRTKCLEWAMTFVLMALRRNWKCNLEIGVQNYPFMAHAWVECDGKTVMDSQEFRTELAIILNEPFRKRKV